jgi:phosphatidylserine decarboxylase
LLQFSLVDPANPTAEPSEIYRKFKRLVYSGDEDDQIPSADFDDLDRDEDTSDEADDQTGGPEVVEKRRRRLRLARLRRKSLAARAYQFSGSGTGVQGIVFMEIVRVTDLPPEKNGMDPCSCLRTWWLISLQ